MPPDRRDSERRAPALASAAMILLGVACAEDDPPASTWTPETAPLVYTSQASGNSDLWLLAAPERAATDPPVRLTHDQAQDHWASVFPGGDRIAFQSLREGQREIMAVGLDGAGLVNLSSHPAQDLLPEVSPDGQRILFFSDRDLDHGPRELPGHLYLMKADGSELERLTEKPLTSTFPGTWAPDGRSILFARDFGGDIDLVRLELESRQEERLRGTAAAEYGGRYSPDGRSIAFHAAGAGEEARIVVMDSDGGGRRELTGGGQHYDPRWSPDGRWLLFTGAAPGESQFDLLVVPVAGGNVEPIVATEVDERSGSWLPTP